MKFFLHGSIGVILWILYKNVDLHSMQVSNAYRRGECLELVLED